MMQEMISREILQHRLRCLAHAARVEIENFTHPNTVQTLKDLALKCDAIATTMTSTKAALVTAYTVTEAATDVLAEIINQHTKEVTK